MGLRIAVAAFIHIKRMINIGGAKEDERVGEIENRARTHVYYRVNATSG